MAEAITLNNNNLNEESIWGKDYLEDLPEFAGSNKKEPSDDNQKELSQEEIAKLLNDILAFEPSGMEKEQYVKYHPEIYNPDEAAIRNKAKGIVNRISSSDMIDYIKTTCEKDWDEAEVFLVNKIAAAYCLKNVPDIIHLDVDDLNPNDKGKCGGFDREHNIIVTYWGEGAINCEMDNIDMLSHELWHAKQQELIQEGEEGKIYDDNFNNYIKPEENPELYKKQIVEAEAYEIGFRMSMKYITAQYAFLDDNDFAQLHSLKNKMGINNISDLDKSYAKGKISKDDYWLLYLDMTSSYKATAS
ncbi:MAG: hypothetical protein Q4A70_01420 [Candidatus Saccharibacteria bacterium]|nr:hypothetical protein [Candidatus Saccharibacteria bacterium]